VMRRAAPMLAGIAGAGILVPFVVGVGASPVTLLLPPLLVVGALAALLAFRRGAVADPRWTGAATIDFTVTSAEPPRARRTAPEPRKVAMALGRVEAHELLFNPWFGAGIGFLAVLLLMLTVVYASDNGSEWGEMAEMAPWLAHPMAGMVVVAAHRAVTRARRDGTDELFEACPADPTTRTWGWLCTAWVPVVALLVFNAAYFGGLALRSPNLYGSPGLDGVAHVLGALTLGAGAVALGVAVGRWVPFALAPVVAVVAVGFASLRLSTFGDPGWNPLQQLSTLPPTSEVSPLFGDRPVWAHLAWLLALTALMVVLAVTRHPRRGANPTQLTGEGDRQDHPSPVSSGRGPVIAAGVVVSLLLVATGVAATRPMSGASAERIAALVARPADHQRCRPAGQIRVCAHVGHGELLDRTVDQVAPVAAVLPAGVAPVTLRQRYNGRVEALAPEVSRRLPGGVPPVPPDEIPLGFDVTRDELLVPRFLVALRALRLPTEPDPDLRPAVVAGQARGVVALWLATRGLDLPDARRLLVGRPAGDPHRPAADTFDRGYAWPEGCGTAPVVWSAQDLRAARALAALPDAAVRDAVHGGWERWRSPDTGTDDLLRSLGLAPAGPFDQVVTRRVDPC
jgi:hypothetical protein